MKATSQYNLTKHARSVTESDGPLDQTYGSKLYSFLNVLDQGGNYEYILKLSLISLCVSK